MNIPVSIYSVSDEDDLRRFRSREDPEFTSRILRVKHNDPEVTDLKLENVNDLDAIACARLGYILGHNTNVKILMLEYCRVGMPWLSAGLHNNRHIQELILNRINLQDADILSSLAPFLSLNPSLKDIILTDCNIGPANLNILSTALLNRPEGSLERLNLGGNSFGDVDLDKLVMACCKNSHIQKLSLANNEIGRNGCSSFVKLLESQESNLTFLDLSRNSIDGDCVITLADVLAKNTKLERLHLEGNNGISAVGWLAILKLVFNGTSINDVVKSNHTVCSIGTWRTTHMMPVYRALGDEDAHLLYASLNMNKELDKTLVSKRKILWAHARGELNIGSSSICTGAMPRILAWSGYDPKNATSWTSTNFVSWHGTRFYELIEYHGLPLPGAEIDTIRLDSFYRILRSRPGLIASS